MVAVPDPSRAASPLHAMLLAWTFPLYLGGLVADIAYARTYEIQWLNFAAWLIAGAMVFTGLALAWSLFEAFRRSFRDRRTLIVLLLVAAMFVVGLLASFQHARDAWGAMPGGLVLSLVVTLLSAAAAVVLILAPRPTHHRASRGEIRA